MKKPGLGGIGGSNGGIDTQISDVTTGSSRCARKGGVSSVLLHSVMIGYDWLRLVCLVGGGHVALRAWDF